MLQSEILSDEDNTDKSQRKISCVEEKAAAPLRYEIDVKYGPDSDYCYLPKAEYDFVALPSEPMGPIGPWATGKTTYNEVNGLTGVRPVSDAYSVTTTSLPLWRTRNKELLSSTKALYDKTDRNRVESEKAVNELVRIVNNAQKMTTKNLVKRTDEIGLWRDRLKEVITRMQDEISVLETQRVRIIKSLVIFGTPESIVGECLKIRSLRPDTELLADEVETELVKELAMINEIRWSLKETLKAFEMQQLENRSLRERLEMDWSGKTVSYDIDAKSASLHNKSKILMFNLSAMKVPPGQASGKYWKYFSEETVKEVEATISRSKQLRSGLDQILTDAAEKLQKQAHLVHQLYEEHIRCIEENEMRLSDELKDCLNKLADAEYQVLRIKDQIASFTAALKVAQTRMDFRNRREGVENCQDVAQLQLIDEVKTNLDGVAGLRLYLDEAERCKQDLIVLRGRLEREIMLKRRVLFLDRDRCLKLRDHYPSEHEMKNF